MDWVDWHAGYTQADSSLSRRLAHVRNRIREALDVRPAGPVRVISMCAGQGRDLLDVLATHPRRADVTARLVELDATNAAAARKNAAGLPGVEIVEGDASTTSAYEPADILLVCGVFGNISDLDVLNTVQHLPMLCRPGAIVIWTRHRGEPDLTPMIRKWFEDNDFEELAFDVEDGFHFSVGTHRLVGPAQPYRPGVRLFRFVGLVTGT